MKKILNKLFGALICVAICLVLMNIIGPSNLIIAGVGLYACNAIVK
jgi:hypothetical protein